MSYIKIPANNIWDIPKNYIADNTIKGTILKTKRAESKQRSEIGMNFTITYFVPTEDEETSGDPITTLFSYPLIVGNTSINIPELILRKYEGENADGTLNYQKIPAETYFGDTDSGYVDNTNNYERIFATTSNVPWVFYFNDLSKQLFTNKTFSLLRKRLWYNISTKEEAKQDIITTYFYNNAPYRTNIYVEAINEDKRYEIDIPKFDTNPNNVLIPNEVMGTDVNCFKDITCVKHQNWFLLNEECSLLGQYRTFEQKDFAYENGTRANENSLEIKGGDFSPFIAQGHFSNFTSNVLGKNRRNTSSAVVKCAVVDYYDDEGNLVVCPEPTSEGQNYPMLIPMYSKVVPYVKRPDGIQPLRKNTDGTPTIYEVIGNDFDFDGVPMQNLTLKEFVE
jgi:hypothetical protein